MTASPTASSAKHRPSLCTSATALPSAAAASIRDWTSCSVVQSAPPGHRRAFHSAAPASLSGRRFNADGEGGSAEWQNSRRWLAPPAPVARSSPLPT